MDISKQLSEHTKELSREELKKIGGGLRSPLTGSWACCKNDNENDCKGALISHMIKPLNRS